MGMHTKNQPSQANYLAKTVLKDIIARDFG